MHRAREHCRMGAQSLPEPSPVINVDSVMAPGAALSPRRAAFLAPVAGVWEKPRLTVKKYWQLESRAKPKRTTALLGAAAERHLQCALSSRAPCKPAPRGSEVPRACTGFPHPSRPHSSFQSLPAPSGSHPGVGGCWPRAPGGHFRGGWPLACPFPLPTCSVPPLPPAHPELALSLGGKD